MVDAHSDHDMVVVVEQSSGASGLERTAVAVGRRPVPVDFTEESARRNVVGCRLIDIDWGYAIADTQFARERSARITRLSVGAVAIDVALPETAIIAEALHRERVSRLPTGSCFKECDLKMRVLRP